MPKPENDDYNDDFDFDSTDDNDDDELDFDIDDYVTKEDYNQLKNQTTQVLEQNQQLLQQSQKQEEWKQHVSRMFADDKGQGEVSDKQLQDYLVSDTSGFVNDLQESTIAKAKEQIRQEQQEVVYQQQVQHDFLKTNPDLMDHYESAILESQKYVNEEAQNGNQISLEAAIKEGADRTRAKLKNYNNNLQKQNFRNSFNFDVNSHQRMPDETGHSDFLGKSTNDIINMSDEAFDKFSKAAIRKKEGY